MSVGSLFRGYIRDLRQLSHMGVLKVIFLFAFVACLWVVNVSHYNRRIEFLLETAKTSNVSTNTSELMESQRNTTHEQKITTPPPINITIKHAEGKMVDELEGLLEDVNATFRNYKVIYKMSKPSNNSFCDGVDGVVYVMTMADRDSTLRRQGLRDFMFSKANLPTNLNIRYRFVMGKYPVRPDYQQLLTDEIKKYDDIIFYNVDEYYRDNYIKWHTMHEWHMRNCPNVKHFIKMDDDTAADFGRTFKWLEKRFDGMLEKKSTYFVCQRMSGYSPVRDTKNKRWYIPMEEFGEAHWPDYCYGYFVVTNNDTISDIMKTQEKINLVHMDDCFLTGIVRRITQADVHDFYGIRTGVTRSKCSKDRSLPYMIALTNGKTIDSLKNKLSIIKGRRC